MNANLDIIGIDTLDAFGLDEALLQIGARAEKNQIACVDWPDSYPYAPATTFSVAHTGENLYVLFEAEDEWLRAEVDKNLGPVASDSCVEFFVKLPDGKEYFNFEFNCIGRINASHRESRNNPTRLTAEQLSQIRTLASCGREPFAEKHGKFKWSLLVSIPLGLIGAEGLAEGGMLLGNFYKCAGKSHKPHYLSWAPIATETPNFHVPEFFGELHML